MTAEDKVVLLEMEVAQLKHHIEQLNLIIERYSQTLRGQMAKQERMLKAYP